MKSPVSILPLAVMALALSAAAQNRPGRAEEKAQPTPLANPVLNGLVGDNTSPKPSVPSTPNPTLSGQEVDPGDVVRVDTALVIVPATVLDRDGRYVANLRREEFRLWEDGVEQQLSYFAPVEKPFTAVLMLDTSWSTSMKLTEIQDAALALADQLRPGDRVMVLYFDDSIGVLAGPTGDWYALRDAIRRTRSGEGTRLYDAVDVVLNHYLGRLAGRKAVVLLTDGVDTRSTRATYQTTIHDSEELDAPVFCVEYDTYAETPTTAPAANILGVPFPGTGARARAPTRSDYDRGDAYLSALAQATGGRVYRPERDNLRHAFESIAEELRQQYCLGYYPKDPPSRGQRRNIKVRVNQPGLVVRARSSYQR